jgi:multiple sugar transport system substrate-binding protein
MACINRRRLLKLSGAGAIAAKSGGLAAILATGRAPAYAQATTVHWLRGSSFVPAADILIKGEITMECQQALGIKLTDETINANDIQARIASSIQSGSGPDIVSVFNNWAHLYAESLAEVDDVADELGKSQGGFYETSRLAAYDGKRWLAVPFNIVGIQIAYRQSWFDEVGYTQFPETWEQYRDAGKKLKAKGRPIGQTLGHTLGDAPNFAYPFLWS